jgi:hypothetical protein
MVDTALHEGELWLEFHRVVNMSSEELASWLRAHSVSSNAENIPGRAGWRHRLMSLGHDPLKPA